MNPSNTKVFLDKRGGKTYISIPDFGIETYCDSSHLDMCKAIKEAFTGLLKISISNNEKTLFGEEFKDKTNISLCVNSDDFDIFRCSTRLKGRGFCFSYDDVDNVNLYVENEKLMILSVDIINFTFIKK